MIKIPKNNWLTKRWWYLTNPWNYQKDSIIDDKVNYWIDNSLLNLTENDQWFNVIDGSELQLDRDGYGIRKLYDLRSCYPYLSPFTNMRIVQYRRKCIEARDVIVRKENETRAKELLNIFSNVDI